jgi:hypothetical protein
MRRIFGTIKRLKTQEMVLRFGVCLFPAGRRKNVILLTVHAPDPQHIVYNAAVLAC